MVWDLLLYVPTVLALASIGLKLYYSESNFSYLLIFLATFFFLVGANRILGGRLMVLPQSPVAMDVNKKSVRLQLRNGGTVELVKDLRFFSDYAGKSFGLAGLDLSGRRRQYVFHRAQFGADSRFNDLKSLLSVYR